MTTCDVPSTISGWMADPDLRRVFIRSAIGVEIDEAGAPFAEMLKLTGLRLALIDRAEKMIGDRVDFAFNDQFVLLVLEAVTRAFLELISHRGRDGGIAASLNMPACAVPPDRSAATRGGYSDHSKTRTMRSSA
jgi:hypothetical protein